MHTLVSTVAKTDVFHYILVVIDYKITIIYIYTITLIQFTNVYLCT